MLYKIPLELLIRSSTPQPLGHGCITKDNGLQGAHHRLANIGILGKEGEPGVGKLGCHGNFDTGFERNTNINI